MKKLFGILLGTAVVAAGAVTAFKLVKKFRKPKDPLESGLYSFNIFKKIACDMNRDIEETERRLAEHDKLQKQYEEMEWKCSEN